MANISISVLNADDTGTINIIVSDITPITLMTYIELNKSYNKAMKGKDEPTLGILRTSKGVLYVTKNKFYLNGREITKQEVSGILKEVHCGSNKTI